MAGGRAFRCVTVSMLWGLDRMRSGAQALPGTIAIKSYWAISRVGSRVSCMHALESAPADGDIPPFAEFVAKEMAASPPSP
jgi:hypothetical protein